MYTRPHASTRRSFSHIAVVARISRRTPCKKTSATKPKAGASGINPRSIDVLAAEIKRRNPDLSNGVSVAIAALALVANKNPKTRNDIAVAEMATRNG